MSNTKIFIELSKLLVDELSTIIGLNESYYFVEPDLQLLDQFYNNFRCFILGSQKLYPCKSRVVVNNY